MKTTLLRKVRRNFRIVKNELGTKKLEERYLFLWGNIDSWELATIEYNYNFEIFLHPEILLQAILRLRYGEYARKYKIYLKKKNTWKKIWYKK